MEDTGQKEREGFFIYILAFVVGSEKVLENFSWGSWKVLEKSWIFFVNKRVGTLSALVIGIQ